MNTDISQTDDDISQINDDISQTDNNISQYVLDISQFFLTNPNNCAKKTNNFGMCHKELGEVVL
jgi:hypothetical protein